MILLTEEEIDACNIIRKGSRGEITALIRETHSDVAKAQLKKVVEFIRSKAWQTGQYGTTIKGYLITEDDVQALLKELERTQHCLHS